MSDAQELLKQKMKEMTEISTAGLTKAEFLAAFKKVTEYLKRTEGELNGKMDMSKQELIQMLNQSIAEMKMLVKSVQDESRASIPNVKKWAIEMLTKAFIKNQVKEKFAQLDEKVAELEAYEPPDPEEIVKKAVEMSKAGLIPLIPVPEELTIESIKGLKEELKKLKERNNVPLGVAASGRQMFYYDLSTSLDGSTRTFDIPAMAKIITVQLSSVPHILRPTTDFTHDYANSQITFTSEIDDLSLATGQTCIITFSN